MLLGEGYMKGGKIVNGMGKGVIFQQGNKKRYTAVRRPNRGSLTTDDETPGWKLVDITSSDEKMGVVARSDPFSVVQPEGALVNRYKKRVGLAAASRPESWFGKDNREDRRLREPPRVPQGTFEKREKNHKIVQTPTKR